ncbi:MAG: EamA family transporter [Chloroflexi bacterium]|nr:EamA family transporter [Chloroflexota bacterium]
MSRRFPRTLVGALFALASAALFATTSIMAKLLYAYEVTPMAVVWGRSAFAVVILGLALAALRPADLRLRRSDVPYFLTLGLLGVAVFSWLLFTTLASASVAVTIVLLYTAPAFVTVLAAIFLREPIVRTKVAGLGAALLGLVLVVGLAETGGLSVNPSAVATGLGAALGYAIYALMAKGAVRRYSTWTTVFYGYLSGVVFLTIGAALEGTPVPSYTPVSLGLHVGLSAVVLASFCLFVAALSRIEASRASILATAEPVFAALLAFAIFGEALTAWQTLGAALVLAGAVVAQLPARAGQARGSGVRAVEATCSN